MCPKCRAVYVSEAQKCVVDGHEIVERDVDPLLGEKLDRYHVRERLGVGAMGVVYRAQHEILDRRYALKVLFGDFGADAQVLERSRREVVALSRIRHPNVVNVVDFGRSPTGLTFIVLEFLEGQLLTRIIEQESPMPPRRAALLLRQAAAGLAAVHAQNLIHRDVKPSNIIVMPPGLSREWGDVEHLKILGFGAVGIPAATEDKRLTSVAHLVGTPTYMAPEQTHEPTVTPVADLYSLGIVAYEMLAGSPPFSGRTRADVLIQHLSKKPPALPDCGGLEHVVHTLLEKHPEERYRTADALGDVLARYLEGGTLNPRPPTPPPPPREDTPSLIIEAELAADFEDFDEDATGDAAEPPSKAADHAAGDDGDGSARDTMPDPTPDVGEESTTAVNIGFGRRPLIPRRVPVPPPPLPEPTPPPFPSPARRAPSAGPPASTPTAAPHAPPTAGRRPSSVFTNAGRPVTELIERVDRAARGMAPGPPPTPAPSPRTLHPMSPGRPIFMVLLVVLTLVCIGLFVAILVDRGILVLANGAP